MDKEQNVMMRVSKKAKKILKIISAEKDMTMVEFLDEVSKDLAKLYNHRFPLE